MQIRVVSVYTHTGIEHAQGKEEVFSYQAGYATQLKPTKQRHYQGKGDDEVATPEALGLFSSLLGGIAWMIQTSAIIAVYVQA